ncbi:MAG: hypothetical protein GY869_16880, partial [Planctomycetes bacterium]|nr:hypothetical protein [Planctomycetota bacterium]
FVGNTVTGSGGGMVYQELNYHNMAPTITNCIFSGNSAYTGGGMYNILSSGETLTISNCTFSGNTAENYVGGIYNSDSTSNININNCVLWGNRDNQNNIQIRPSWVEGVSYCCIQDDDPNDAEIFKGVGNIDDDPLFMDSDGDDNIVGTEDDNLHLQPGSPAIDAGDNAAVAQDYADQDDDDDLEEKTPWDFDGDDRFDDDPHTVDTGNDAGLSGVVDMGCYENPKNVFIFSSKLVTVPEGESAFFTVALLRDPNGSVEVTVLRRAGDEDIDVESGGILIFDSWNYDNPQTVTLSAEGDSDYFDGTAQFVINGAKTVTAIVNAIEYDSTPSVLYVDVDAPGAEDGTDWNNAFTDLQAALQFRADQLRIEQIRVAGGRYTPASPGGDREASFEMAEGLRIEGGYAGYGQVDPNDRDITLYETILSGDLDGNDSVVGDPIEMIDDPLRADNSFTVVTGNDVDETAVLDGFTISGGHNAQSSGGGVSGDYNSSVLLNCTIRGNWANPNGGGIYSFGTFQLIDCIIERNGANHNGGGVNGNAALVRCVVKENTAGNNGGGIYGNINLTDCEIRSNTADRGGGMYNRHSPIISNSIFIDNQADYNGGGVYNEKTMMISCMPTFNNCTFSFNRANDDGGGMYNRCPSFVAGYCQPVLNSCIFNYNVAVGDGGGICSDYSNPTLTNCIMHDNSATINGGGMYNTNSKQKLTNCTFAGNSAVSGNTLACVSPGKPSTLTISSSIFWDGGGAIANNDGSTIDMLYCDVQGGWPGTTNIETDPCFVDAGGGDFHLMSEAGRWDANMLVWREDEMTSACIDAGDPNMDWVGELWPDGGRVNMGVYGGTAEAGMSLNLVGNGADLNGDGVVDFLDWGLLGEKWMLREVLLKADVDRDGVVGLSDLWLFSGEWLWGK